MHTYIENIILIITILITSNVMISLETTMLMVFRLAVKYQKKC